MDAKTRARLRKAGWLYYAGDGGIFPELEVLINSVWLLQTDEGIRQGVKLGQYSIGWVASTHEQRKKWADACRIPVEYAAKTPLEAILRWRFLQK